VAVLGIVPLLLMTAQAWSHHSGAMFDDRKSATLSGTVRLFQWTNPHCWIQLVVPGQQGTSEWSIEMGSPALLFRGGWRPKTLQPGDKITLQIRPLRDGTNGGLFLSGTLADGKAIGAPR
jgi:hypothetical protein